MADLVFWVNTYGDIYDSYKPREIQQGSDATAMIYAPFHTGGGTLQFILPNGEYSEKIILKYLGKADGIVAQFDKDENGKNKYLYLWLAEIPAGMLLYEGKMEAQTDFTQARKKGDVGKEVQEIVEGDWATLITRIENIEDLNDKQAEQIDKQAKEITNSHTAGTTEFKKLMNACFRVNDLVFKEDLSYTVERMVEEYGGAWEEINAKMIMGAGSITEEDETFTFNVGDTGGEVKHTLTKAEMPSHTHNQSSFDENSSVSLPTSAKVVAGDWTWFPRSWWNGINQQLVETVGGDTAHNNMPPYLVVKIFKRTALFTEE